MEETDKYTKVAQWLDGKLSVEEIEHLEKDVEMVELRAQLDRVSSYEYPKMNTDEVWKKLQTKKEKGDSKSNFLLYGLRVAASILVIITVNYFYFSAQSTKLYAERGVHASFDLPAGSKLVLNAGSSLDYFHKDWSKSRKMILEGEGYFDVTKGSPFIVESEFGKVSVLGTQFNVFNRYDRFTVTCYEGSVQVDVERLDTTLVLERGEKLSFSDSGLQLEKEAGLKPLWLENISSFEKVELQFVFQELEDQYNIEVNQKGVKVDRLFSGDIPQDNLNIALQRLCGAMNLGFEIKNEGKKVEIFKLDNK